MNLETNLFITLMMFYFSLVNIWLFKPYLSTVSGIRYQVVVNEFGNKSFYNADDVLFFEMWFKCRYKLYFESIRYQVSGGSE